MKTITIEHPEDVKALLDRELGDRHWPMYSDTGWSATHWFKTNHYVDGKGANSAELLADLRTKIAAHDPIAKLREEAEKHGYVLMKLPED